MRKKNLISFVGIGIEAIAIIMTSVWVGQWVDLHWQLKNLFTTILPLVGLIAWVYHVLVLVKKISHD